MTGHEGGKRDQPYPPEGLRQIEKLAKKMNRPDQWHPTPGSDLFVGVDLGTSYVVVVVIDEKGDSVAGTMRFASIAKEGLVIDYIGATEIVKEMVESVQSALGVGLRFSATAFPPKTESANIRTTEYILESVGLEVLKVVDEPSAANRVLSIRNGAIVDIGGGTTGIAIVEGGKISYTGDEPTGGTHLNLVIAGRKGISFEEAETYKMENQEETMEIVFPVIQKMAAIIRNHIGQQHVEIVHLVGGTSDLLGIEGVMEDELGIAVEKPQYPQLVTPLGIALACLEEH